MNRLTRSHATIGVLSLLLVVLSGCGKDPVPTDAVAVVGDRKIERSAFDRWLRITAIATRSAGDREGAPVVVPDPPGFAECIASKRRSAAVLLGRPAPAVAQLKAQCQQEYASLRDQVMHFLLNAARLEAEADDAGVKLSESEVDAQVDRIRKQSFATEADFERFLRRSGMTTVDLMFRTRVDALFAKLRERALTTTKRSDKPASAKLIRDYYAQNKRRFAQPERRDLRLVLTRGWTRALQARAALRRGRSFASVAREFSIDATSKAQGGTRPALARGQSEQALERAVFAARRGEIVGPVRTRAGHYVFAVQRIRPASERTLRQATPLIRQLIRSRDQQVVVDRLVSDVTAKWKQRTECRAGFETRECKNAPKSAATRQPQSQTGATRSP